MKNSWKFLVAILLLLGMLSVVAANPLVVTYQERYNITANVSAEGTIDYSLHSLIGYLVINNTASKDILSDVWVAIDIQNNVSEPKVVHDTTPKGVYITNSVPAYTGLPDGLTYVHVPILPNKTYVEIVIELNKSKIGIPIIVNEAHSITKVPAYKMVTWNVTFNISRNVSVLPSEDTQVYVNVTKYLSNDPNHYGSSYWTYLNISNAKASMGDIELWDSRYFNGTAKDALNWTNVVLSKLRDKEIIGSLNFAVTANNSYTGREAIEVPYGFAVIFFDFSGSVSNTTVKDVYAIGDCEVIVDKRGPELDTTTGQYILWYENTSFKNAGNEYYYNITKVNIWAVNGSDPEKLNPFDKSLWINGSNYSLSPNIIKGPGEIWSSDNYNFTFPGVPVVWANYSFKIAEESITLLQHVVNEYQDEYGSSYIVVEKIYLVGSYLIKVTKTIKTNEDGTYTIYIVVENIGSHKSPFVYVYDLIPHNFTIVAGPTVYKNTMLNHSGNNILNNNPRYNLSYYWCLNPLNGGADGDGWYSPEEINNNQTVLINYTVNGTGVFIPSDLFIVGIDPTHSLLPTTSPKMIIVGGSDGNNYEVLLALLTGLVGMVLVARRVKR